MTEEEPAATRVQRRPDDRPEELLDAALGVFGERGFKAATLDEVASRAGVSKGTVYLYFSSKEALFQAVVEKKVVTRVESNEELMRSYSGSSKDLLELMITRLWNFIGLPEIAAITRVVQAELPQFPELHRYYFENVIQRHRQLLRAVATRGVTTGEFRAEAVDLVPLMVPSLVLHIQQRRALFSKLDTNCPAMEVELDMVLSLVLHGISAHPQPADQEMR